MDVTMRRATSAPMLIGVDKPSLKAGATDATMRIYGDALPSQPDRERCGSWARGQGNQDHRPATWRRYRKRQRKPGRGPRKAHGRSEERNPSRRLCRLRSHRLPESNANHIDRPPGGSPHPKGYVQFETVAFNNGPDGKPNTDDDIDLGPVPATYKMEEFVASYGDDDTDFVGAVDDKTGLFTPASDGPDPKRKSMRNNYGDVWITATYNEALLREEATWWSPCRNISPGISRR